MSCCCQLTRPSVPPAKQAAAVYFLTALTLKHSECWPRTLQQWTGFSVEELIPVVQSIYDSSFSLNNITDHRGVELSAVNDRYERRLNGQKLVDRPKEADLNAVLSRFLVSTFPKRLTTDFGNSLCPLTTMKNRPQVLRWKQICLRARGHSPPLPTELRLVTRVRSFHATPSVPEPRQWEKAPFNLDTDILKMARMPPFTTKGKQIAFTAQYNSSGHFKSFLIDQLMRRAAACCIKF